MKEKLIKSLGEQYYSYLDDCLGFLLALSQGLKPRHTLKIVIELCLRANLIIKKGDFYFPLGESQEITKYGTWEWVITKFLQEFIDVNLSSSKYYKSQLVGRMKKFMVSHAKEGNFITPLEIIEATNLYCRVKANSNLFGIREPRYFIFKGKVDESDLLDYILKIREEKQKTEESSDDSITNITMQ